MSYEIKKLFEEAEEFFKERGFMLMGMQEGIETDHPKGLMRNTLTIRAEREDGSAAFEMTFTGIKKVVVT